jgi:hypothetical protein
VKNRFQSLPLKCNLQRYTAGSSFLSAANNPTSGWTVGFSK